MSDQGASWTDDRSFLERNPHLRENYLRVCQEFKVEPYSDDAPEYIAAIGLERPPVEIFTFFRRLHGITPAGPS